tara:strand:+ start:161 stop:304 length:144 start_codon:yes stop_codon:yes gene_type:complete
MTYKLFQTDEDGNKYYIIKGNTTTIINADDEHFKEWVAAGNTPEEAD